MNNVRIDILNRIISKGGLHASVAQMFLDDESSGNAFITECFMQCHNKSVLGFWGVELVLDIVRYRLMHLRMLYEECVNDQYHYSKVYQSVS